jgi:uncharacterized protein YndB with AHSA1/START domain
MEPLRLQFTVACPAERAFALWAEETTRWWPHGHSVSGAPGLTVTFEPRAGGRIFERTPDGAEHDWGEVLAWEPPHRVVLVWRLSAEFAFDQTIHTEIEVRFEPQDGASTRVTLEHRGLDAYGDKAAEMRETFGSEGGWNGLLRRFAEEAAA